ncbi:MAG TPA: APC family permease [Candidatus Baltobacteraceae bacterium]|nr:APC family permease [Candidatus Baltobacteraceae bacterium]
MISELNRAERAVAEHSVELKKPLGLRDLVLTQIVFVVGSSWVGTAAKLGPAHLFFWLLAILLFYVPQAAVVIYLNRLMPLEGGIYQWAKFAFNEFAGFIVAWNLWLLSIMVIALGGMFITTNLSYAFGDAGAWMRNSPWCVSLISCALVGSLGWTSVRGLSLGKWLHNIGGFAMLLAYAALIVLPFVMLARGNLSAYHPLQIAAPTMSIFYCVNIFTKLAVGALSGFEYVDILAGETRAPARNIGRSVMIAAPIIALMFILGTSSVLAFIGDNPIDLIGPVPQTLRLGLHSFRIAGAIASIAILLMTVRSISSISIHFTGSSRLPMVAGWDHLLPPWFSRLHARYKTPINSIIFVGAVTLVIGISSQIGAGMQEAFQLVDNAANVFYGIVYAVMFAIPIVGAAAVRARARIWLRLAAACGLAVSLLAIFFTIYPIIDVPSPLIFAAKIVLVTVIANAIGIAIFALGEKRRRAAQSRE